MLATKRTSVDAGMAHSFVPRKTRVSPAQRSRSISSEHSITSGDTPVTDPSIVLIGMRGTGKSSLAIMASSALDYKVIDTDQQFYESTGMSRAAYSSKHGAQEYKRHELQLMRSALRQNPSRCVITCGPGCVEDEGRSLLAEYAKQHPVIYILRDADSVQKYLRAWDAKTISNLINLSAPTFRSISNLEFYNISESRSPETELAKAQYHPALTLKNLQHDFLRLLYHVTAQAPRGSRQGSGYEAGHVVSSLAPELKNYTYALTLHLSTLPEVISELPSFKTIADAVLFVVDSLPKNDSHHLDPATANRISKYLHLVRRYTQVPIIFQVNQSIALDNEEQYFAALHHGLRFSPEYICVDLTATTAQISKLSELKGSAKFIGTLYDADPGENAWESQDRQERYREAQRMGCDMVWMSQPAMSFIENASVQRFTYQMRSGASKDQLPLIAFNTGSLGRISQWQNSVLTPVDHASLRSILKTPRCDQTLTIAEAQMALYSSFTLDKMQFGVFGSKVTNSVSPACHNAGYQAIGMPHSYQYFQYSTLKDVEHIFRDHFFGGASVSSPFKRDIISMIDHLSPEAQAIGAVNTLVPLRGGDKADLLEDLLNRNHAGPVTGFFGDNTDWIAIYNAVSRNLSPINAVNGTTSAVVLGAGGMARAAVYAMIRLGVRNIFICNRTVQKAKEVADHFQEWSRHEAISNALKQTSQTGSYRSARKVTGSGAMTPRHPERYSTVRVIDDKADIWPAEFKPPTMIISTLPGCDVKDKSVIDNTIPRDWFTSPTGGVVAELAYNPLETPLLKQASAKKGRGWIPVDGLQISLEQAAPQFELFTGRKPPKDQMRVGLLAGYAKLLRGESHNGS